MGVRAKGPRLVSLPCPKTYGDQQIEPRACGLLGCHAARDDAQPTLGFLTLRADGQSQPVTSTFNAIDGAITSNMAIVPTTNGSIDAYAKSLTQLILDIVGYFAP